jgi:hypothetical protein
MEASNRFFVTANTTLVHRIFPQRRNLLPNSNRFGFCATAKPMLSKEKQCHLRGDQICSGLGSPGRLDVTLTTQRRRCGQ